MSCVYCKNYSTKLITKIAKIAKLEKEIDNLNDKLLKLNRRNTSLQKRSSSRRSQILRLQKQLEMERHLAKLGIS